jgi:hypothetical protein
MRFGIKRRLSKLDEMKKSRKFFDRNTKAVKYLRFRIVHGESQAQAAFLAKGLIIRDHINFHTFPNG